VDEFFFEIKSFCKLHGVKFTQVNDKHIKLMKINTFKVYIIKISGRYNAQFCKKRKSGYYGWTMNARTTETIKIRLDEYIKLEPVKTPPQKSKEQFLVNMIGRELMESLKSIDPKAKINKLAKNEEDGCKISSWVFRSCEIYDNRTYICWHSPCFIMSGRTIEYDVKNPSFDPTRLIAVIMEFVKELKSLNKQMSEAGSQMVRKWSGDSDSHIDKGVY